VSRVLEVEKAVRDSLSDLRPERIWSRVTSVVRVGNIDKAKKNGEASARVAFKPESVRDKHRAIHARRGSNIRDEVDGLDEERQAVSEFQDGSFKTGEDLRGPLEA
jgi:hypothetical protein